MDVGGPGRRPEQRAIVQRLARFGSLLIDNDARTVTLSGEPIQLTRTEFDLLSCLASLPGTVVDTQEMLRHVEWSSYDNSIEVHISRLRRKLGESARSPRFIHTVRGVGYRFEPGVREIVSPEAKQQLQFASDGRGIVYAALDPMRIIQWVTTSAIPVLAIDPDEWIGKSVYEFIHPEDIPYTRRIGTELDRGAPRTLQFRMRHGEREWVPLIVRAQPVFDGEIFLGNVAEWSVEPPAGDRWSARPDTVSAAGEEFELLYDCELVLRSVSPIRPFLGWNPTAAIGTSMHIFADRPSAAGLTDGYRDESAKLFRDIAEGQGPIALRMQRVVRHADGTTSVRDLTIRWLTNEVGDFDGIHISVHPE